MGKLDELPWVLCATRAEWRAWLEAHHAEAEGVWLVTWRKGSGQPVLAYEDLCEEAVCFGWVDSRPAKVDDRRTRILVSPRKPGSGWSRPNKERVARAEANGAMAAGGRACVEAAKADGSWSKLDAVENLEVPADLSAAFDAHPGSRAEWEGFPRSVKRGILEWIVTAKRAGTRSKRVEETARLAARGERANQWPRKKR